jgi:hypothetical protein
MDPISGQIASQMAEQASQVSEHQSAGQGESAKSTSFQEVLSDVQTREAEKASPVAEVEPAAQAEGPAATRLRDFLDQLRTDETRLDRMMSKSMSGAEMSPQDLLQMQALIYSYSQKVEIVSKAVSSASSGMKQMMNTQV